MESERVRWESRLHHVERLRPLRTERDNWVLSVIELTLVPVEALRGFNAAHLEVVDYVRIVTGNP